MRSPAFHSLPIIDISGLRSGDATEIDRVAAELAAAAHEVGFFYISEHGIPEEEFDGLLQAAQAFFDQDEATKMESYIGLSSCHRGYVPPGEEGGYSATSIDLKEAFDTALDLPADDPDHLAGNPMLGPNLWPDIPGFQEAVTAYYERAMDLGRDLLGAFAISLGEPADTFAAATTRSPSQLRLIHYPFEPDAVDRLGIGAHTDFECLTLLRPTAPGLEVMNQEGEWIDAPPLPGCLVVNIGDLLETWTNGYFVATSHRVRKVAEERWSFPLFVNVDYDTVVEPLEQFRQAGVPLRPRILAGEHLYAQTIQVFAYLRARLAAGEIELPEGSAGLNEFGQLARHADASRS